MARKRLGGPLPDYLDAAPPATAKAPIAQVAGETAALAAFAAVADELAAARAGGRMVLALPLAAVATDYLIRDRVAFDREEMEALKASLAARGQQMPVEVVEIGGGRFGLISGARRMMALRELAAESDDESGEARFGTVLALVRRPEGGADPYVAMVEENEIRVGLSFYERARIVMRSVEAGVYETEKKALQGLFATASFAKRSKVKSFIPVVTALDGALRFPARIPERLGLRLARALADAPGFGARAVAALQAAGPGTPEAEALLLAGLLRPEAGPEAGAETDRGADADDLVLVETWSDATAPGADLRITVEPGRVTIEGPGADAAFLRDLRDWIAAR